MNTLFEDYCKMTGSFEDKEGESWKDWPKPNLPWKTRPHT
jgi:hypothetical protein